MSDPITWQYLKGAIEIVRYKDSNNNIWQRNRTEGVNEQIEDELIRQVKKCMCPKQYHMHKITDGQYRVCFGFHYHSMAHHDTTCRHVTLMFPCNLSVFLS